MNSKIRGDRKIVPHNRVASAKALGYMFKVSTEANVAEKESENTEVLKNQSDTSNAMCGIVRF